MLAFFLKILNTVKWSRLLSEDGQIQLITIEPITLIPIIPITTEEKYKLQLVEKIEAVIKRIHWTAGSYKHPLSKNWKVSKKVVLISTKNETLENTRLTPADKTSNFHKLAKEKYEQLLHNSITKTFKKRTLVSRKADETR